MQDIDTTFDFAVLGGGSGGYAAARTAHSLGLKVAVIDGAEELGGLCILRGCMPSKTLIESADRNLVIRHAQTFGLQAQSGPPDILAIRDRKRELIADFAGYRQGQLEDGRWQMFRGHGAFLDKNTVEITPRDGSPAFSVTARTWCIATGSVPNIPPIPGLTENGFWTSDDVLDAAALPHSFAVLGGGAIALEMAHYLEGVGRQVTLIQRNEQLLTGIDRAASDVLCDACEKRGIQTFCGTKIHGISLTEGKKCITFSHGTEQHSIAVDEILVALGRNPATAGLRLEHAHVSHVKGKITVNGAMQTSQPHIFAAGDVCSPLDVVHIAIQQGEIAARNAHRFILGHPIEEHMDYRLLLFGVFSHPQVAVVGANQSDLEKAQVPFVTASYPFNDHGKSMVMGETDGFVKMLAHRETGEILGAVCVGPHATELIHEVVVAMHHRCTAAAFAAIPHYHPTLSEIWTYPAEDCASQVSK